MITDQFNDTRTYVVHKTNTGNNRTSAAGGPPRPRGAVPDAATRRMMEIENETEDFSIERTPVSMGQRMRNLRAEKEWSQKDLATRANVKVDVVRDYENGKAIPDKKLIAKFEQLLGGSIRDKPAPQPKRR